ncbi:hypothetical protein E2C01_056261 [Portunus trituberculatus]|uniref:Uncharacterized protein n=1 Tax=Portunus trituberculatus TaxID=210409 RepID=A0A5B7GZ45_PORTR|nr:hypothetical protein [Portunus trituberculatus]
MSQAPHQNDGLSMAGQDLRQGGGTGLSVTHHEIVWRDLASPLSLPPSHPAPPRGDMSRAGSRRVSTQAQTAPRHRTGSYSTGAPQNQKKEAH